MPSFDLLNLLYPSFLRDSPRYTTTSPQTAHLDGLRGLASFIVLLCHTAYSSHDLSYGYGYIGERSQYQDTYRSPWRLPIVRLIYNGDAAVAMFFLISGFALSWRPLKAARAHNWAAFARALLSSSLRRFVRLFAPVAVSTLLICLAVQARLYEPTRGIATDGVRLTAFREPHPEPKPNILVMLADWAHTNWRFYQLFHWDRDFVSVYDIHLWTIPVELRASMALFATLLATAAMRPAARQATLAALVPLAAASDCWPMMLFFAGAAEADAALARGEGDVGANGSIPGLDAALPALDKLPGAAYPARRPRASLARWLLWPPVLFLMSQPFHSDETRFWRTLSRYIPASFSEPRRFYSTLGCIAAFCLINRSARLRAALRHPVCQYLCRISYGMYLVHAFVLHTVGYAAFAAAWRVTGIEGGAREAGFVLGAAATLPVVVWASDVFWRGVDEPCVRLARWVEKRVLVEM